MVELVRKLRLAVVVVTGIRAVCAMVNTPTRARNAPEMYALGLVFMVNQESTGEALPALMCQPAPSHVRMALVA